MTPEEQRKVAEVTDVLTGKHKKWLTEYAEGIGDSWDYERLMRELDDSVANGGEGIHVGADETDFDQEVWVHYQAIRAVEVSPEVKHNTYFSCAC